MATEWGLGPVFAYEWLTTARRWQVYALRSLFVTVLLVGLVTVWLNQVSRRSNFRVQDYADVGRSVSMMLIGVQLALVLLAAPAATAGSICLDKARGTLTHLLVTDLSDAEIILGNLAARLMPVVSLILCALPVTALGTLLGGVDPVELTGAYLVIVGVGVLGCTMALTLSVWGEKTHEVLMANYVLWIGWILVAPVWGTVIGNLGWGWTPPEFVIWSNPIALVYGPSSRPGVSFLEYQALFLLGCVVLSAVLAVVAIWRVRRVSARQAGRVSSGSRGFRLLSWVSPRRWTRHFPGPSLDGNPILWREWHRNRPSRWSRVIWGIYVVAAIAFSVYAFGLAFHANRSDRDMAAVINGMQVSAGLLLLSVVSATSLSEERVRGSLDVVLATPLTTRSILWGKWWGAYRNVPFLTILPFLVSATLAGHTGRWAGPPLIVALILAYGAALTSLGLAVATWVSRVGRALAVCVTAYVLVTVGSIPMAMLLAKNNDNIGPGLAAASPFWGTGYFSALIGGNGGGDQRWMVAVVWSVIWIVVYSAVALGLWAATLMTFDRCLGRITIEFPPESNEWKPLARKELVVDVYRDFG